MTLPSVIGGRVTEQVGYFHARQDALVPWLRQSLGDAWAVRATEWASLSDAVDELAISRAVTRRAAIPVGSWTLLLTNGPLGTDVGMLPSLAARQLGCRALRAVCIDDDDGEFPARVLELFGPDGSGPLLARRSIAAANDGGRWVFETAGDPLPFEDAAYYARRRKSDRFPRAVLYEYLRQLDVPIEVEPDWHRAQLIALDSS